MLAVADAVGGRHGIACRVEERPEWGPWVTSRKLAVEPIHRWFVFPHSFSPQLAGALFGEWNLGEDDIVLDPFVGAGTALLAAQNAGLPSVGYDLSPLSAFASCVKVSPPSAVTLNRAWALVKPKVRVRHRLPAEARYDDLVERAFPGDLLPTLDGARRAILDARLSGRTKDALVLALLGVLPAFSRLIRKGGWLEERVESMSADRVRDELAGRVQLMIHDVSKRASVALPQANASIADARQLPVEDSCVSALVTSPPYPNRHDYTRVFGVELQFAFLDWESLRRLRYQSFSSHPESKPEREKNNGYTKPAGLSDTINAIRELITDPRAKNRIPRMLHGYFEDTYLALREMHRVLRPEGAAAVVVGNVSYCGVSLDVDRYVVDISRQVGLEPRVVYVARRRGNSAQQMKDHGRRPQRESVIVLGND
jgi:hypothetical protein